MPVTAKELEDFLDFARQAMERKGGEVESIRGLACLWDYDQNFAESVARLRLSEADDEAGRTMPVDEAIAEIRQKLGWEK